MASRYKFYERVGGEYGWYIDWDPSGLQIQNVWLLDYNAWLSEEDRPISNMFWALIFPVAKKVAWFDKDSGNYYDLKGEEWEPVDITYFDE